MNDKWLQALISLGIGLILINVSQNKREINNQSCSIPLSCDWCGKSYYINEKSYVMNIDKIRHFCSKDCMFQRKDYEQFC